MKRNIKKIALLIIITVISTVMSVATVTAKSQDHRAIRGQYASSGMVTGMIAFCGFDQDTLIPIYAEYGMYALNSSQANGQCTFQDDNTGNCSDSLAFIFMPNQLLSLPPCAAELTGSYKFTYSLNPDGSIFITPDPGSFIGTWISGCLKGTPEVNGPPSFRGYVSPDSKVITLTTYPITPVNLTGDHGCFGLTAQKIEVQSILLIWQHDIK